MSVLRRLSSLVVGERLPESLAGALDAGEDVVGHAEAREVVGAARSADQHGEHLAVTALGLWVPSGAGLRRIGWHLISKAVWEGDTLTVTEAEETGRAGQAVLLADRAPVRYVLPRPGQIPRLVRQRVEGSIRARYRKELSGGGAWFVLRKLPGTDGSVLQVRPDPGTDVGAVEAIAEEAAAKLAQGAS